VFEAAWRAHNAMFERGAVPVIELLRLVGMKEPIRMN